MVLNHFPCVYNPDTLCSIPHYPLFWNTRSKQHVRFHSNQRHCFILMKNIHILFTSQSHLWAFIWILALFVKVFYEHTLSSTTPPVLSLALFLPSFQRGVCPTYPLNDLFSLHATVICCSRPSIQSCSLPKHL